MKKLLLSAVVLTTLAMGANAQTQKGYYMIGGDIGNISADLQKGGSTFGIGVTPKAAWFIQDNFAIGGQVGLGYKTQKHAGNTLTYNIGPFARYYFGKDQMSDVNINTPKHVRFFGEANAGFAGSNTKIPGQDAATTNGFNVGVGPGVAFFVNENIALEALAKYDLTLGFGTTPTINHINVGVGFQIYLPGSRLKALHNDMKK